MEMDRGDRVARRESFYPGTTDGTRDIRRGDFDRGDNRNSLLNNRADINRDRFASRDQFDNRNQFGRDRDNWSQTSNRIRGDWSRRNRNDLPFRFGWWNNYSRNNWPVFGPWGYARWRDRPYYWWGWTPAGQLTDWLVFGWNSPRYWEYGPGGNIYYQDDYVYYDGDRYLPVDDYYQRIYNLAHSVPQIDQATAEKMDWSPLGVFDVVRDNDRDSDQRSMQLAVNKEGVLSGTYYNSQRGQVHPLTGMVDAHTQRAAWAFADGEHPKTVFETSVYNLTKPESTMMVHFGAGSRDAEVWHLVRLEQPQEGAQADNAPSNASSGGNELP